MPSRARSTRVPCSRLAYESLAASGATLGDLALEDDAEQVTYANGEVAEVRDNPKLAPGEYGVAPTPWSAVQGAAWVTLTKGASV